MMQRRLAFRVSVGLGIALCCGLILVVLNLPKPGQKKFHEPISRALTEEEFLDRLVSALLSFDRSRLREACTEKCWQRFNRQYDFMISYKPYQGTFNDLLTQCGEWIGEGRQRDVTRTTLPTGVVVLYFENGRTGQVTMGFEPKPGNYRVVYFSVGNIDPDAVAKVLLEP